MLSAAGVAGSLATGLLSNINRYISAVGLGVCVYVCVLHLTRTRGALGAVGLVATESKAFA